MLRKTFDNELALLHTKLVEMGDLCVEGIDLAVEALFEKVDMSVYVKKAHEIERETDRKERDIEDLCMKLILRHQPVARDLKTVSAALKMIADMERIGDQIADLVDIAEEQENKTLGGATHIKDMSMTAKKMITDAVKSFVMSDTRLAEQVILKDEEVDDMFLQLKVELLEVIKEDISKGELVLDVLLVAKYFERLGDHAVNIAEWVEFINN